MIVILMGMSEWTLAQEQNNIWFFGNKAGLDFNSTPPRPLESDLFTLEGTASISDPAGHLLFYTNGATIWDRDHNIMPNGTGLLGGESSTQAALIVPLPKSCNQYYLFATEDHNTNGGLTYSVIDMCLNNGLGDVIVSEKNKLIVDRSAEKITAVLHANGVDIWILTHTLGSNDFLAYLLSDAGLNTTPVVSSIGSFYPSDGHIGPVKASHDGSKIVSSSTFRDICEMFDFNSATGQLSNFYDINQLFNIQHWVYGIEFSPNDSLLYLSTCFVTNYLYQLNIKSKQIITLNTTPGHYHYGALQMGPDKKIYMARNDSAFLDVIHQPDLPGLGCQYVEGGQNLSGGTTSQLGLPNFAPYSFFPVGNTVLSLGNDKTLCEGDSIVLSVTVPSNCAANFMWSNGSTEHQIIIHQPGLYWVEVENSCIGFRDSIQIDLTSCQPECSTSVWGIYGSPTSNERAKCIIPTADNTGFYLGGFKDDSVLIANLGLDGTVEWSRTFEIVPGEIHDVNSILLDSEGMLAVAGTTGGSIPGNSVFMFRYNPVSHQVLWAHEIISAAANETYALIQKGPAGNYVMSNNPSHLGLSNEDSELLEIDKNTGSIVQPFSTDYDLGSSDHLVDLVYHKNFIYGVGRYTDGLGQPKMRHSLVKISGATGSQTWVKLGHVARNQTARFYGIDLVIDQDEIYSIYQGDPAGTSFTNSKLYIQKTSLDGNLIWLKQYEFPGNSDQCYELIKSGNGYVALALKAGTPSEIILFKINADGEVLWANVVQPSSIINAPKIERAASQLIQMGSNLIFTATGTAQNGKTDMLIVRTDLEGQIANPCMNTIPISVIAANVVNPVFYNVQPKELTVMPDLHAETPQVVASILIPRQECAVLDTVTVMIEATICVGESFEGYTQPGTYSDTFSSIEGCDSIRVLDLEVEMPDKFQEVSICSGGEFENYTMAGTYIDTIPGLMSECDTIRYLTITTTPPLESFINHEICEGDSFLGYDTTGIFSDTFQTVEGCDSTRILNLQVTNQIYSSIDIEICLGDNYKGYDESGVYVDTLQAVFGCDSIVSLQLAVIPVETMIEVEICSGGNFENYSLPGTFVDTLKGVASPCDTIRQITLTVLQPIETMLEKSICVGENYFGYNLPGVYTDTIVTNAGCDSIRTVNLGVTDHISTTIEASICEGSLSGYNSAGTFIDTLVTRNGCDSIRTLVLTGGSKYIPNVFSPNDDGVNDLFIVFQFPDNSLDFKYFGIYDRFGDMTYETDQWPIEWYGKRSDGLSFSPGVFAYILIYNCDQERIIEHGNITLIK